MVYRLLRLHLNAALLPAVKAISWLALGRVWWGGVVGIVWLVIWGSGAGKPASAAIGLEAVGAATASSEAPVRVSEVSYFVGWGPGLTRMPSRARRKR
jgi:hypothetical protein